MDALLDWLRNVRGASARHKREQRLLSAPVGLVFQQ
jgi:hypothetical protein